MWKLLEFFKFGHITVSSFTIFEIVWAFKIRWQQIIFSFSEKPNRDHSPGFHDRFITGHRPLLVDALL